jgi:hypothetical protein
VGRDKEMIICGGENIYPGWKRSSLLGCHRGTVENLKRKKHKGEPKLPFNFVVVRALFLLLRGGLFLFLVTVTLYRFFRSPSGIKSKRIFLSADLLFRRAIQPVRELPEGSFIVLCPVAGCSEKHPEKHTFSKKIC